LQDVEFYYDLRSPYTYFAWNRRSVLEKVGARLTYVPVSIDALLNLQGGRDAWADYADPLAPPKRQHLMSDIPRMARFWRIPLGGPFRFKPQSKRAMCLATALQSSGQDQEMFIDFALRTLWQEAKNLADDAVFNELVAVANLPNFSETTALVDLTSNTERAYQAGIFGVPSFRFNGQVYFGADRMEVLASELQRSEESINTTNE
jgi:2-hydroxychromene-2-carboxylate isomerase